MRVGEAAHPTELLAAVGDAGVPEAHRGEVRQAGVGIAATFDDGQHAVFKKPLETDQGRVEPHSIGNRQEVVLRDSEIRTRSVVSVVAERHHGVETVVAAGELDDDEDSLRVLLSGSSERLSRQSHRGAV